MKRMKRWYVKRRPLGKSFFRDGFPYFQRFHGGDGGSLWVLKRSDACAFKSLSVARRACRLLRDVDPEIRIVRVSPRPLRPGREAKEK